MPPSHKAARVNTSEAALALGISERQLRILHEQTPQEDIPGAPVNAGGGSRQVLRWDPDKLDQWMRERRSRLPKVDRPTPTRPPAELTPQIALPLPKSGPKAKQSLLSRAKALNAARP